MDPIKLRQDKSPMTVNWHFVWWEDWKIVQASWIWVESYIIMDNGADPALLTWGLLLEKRFFIAILNILVQKL